MLVTGGSRGRQGKRFFPGFVEISGGLRVDPPSSGVVRVEEGSDAYRPRLWSLSRGRSGARRTARQGGSRARPGQVLARGRLSRAAERERRHHHGRASRRHRTRHRRRHRRRARRWRRAPHPAHGRQGRGPERQGRDVPARRRHGPDAGECAAPFRQVRRARLELRQPDHLRGEAVQRGDPHPRRSGHHEPQGPQRQIGEFRYRRERHRHHRRARVRNPSASRRNPRILPTPTRSSRSSRASSPPPSSWAPSRRRRWPRRAG